MDGLLSIAPNCTQAGAILHCPYLGVSVALIKTLAGSETPELIPTFA
jgi:hypothetical protein